MAFSFPRSTRHRIFRLAGLAIALCLVLRCGGRKAEKPLEPSFGSIQTHVFDKQCALADCHAGLMPESQLILEEKYAYGQLVNRPSVGIPELLLINPHHSGQSYLVLKLEGGQIVGEQMPLGEAPLPDSVIAVIRQWIDNGAPEN